MSNKLSKLPPKGSIDIEAFPLDLYVLTVKREDGKELSISMKKEDLKNLAEYILELVKIKVF